jgi:Serine/threonine protein kinase
VNLLNISHYRILQKLGSGGSAEIFLAEDANLKRKVALKLLHRHLTADKEKLERFRQEAQWACILNHPNILTIYEVGEQDGVHFIVTEYVEGETLRQALTRRLPLSTVLDIAIGIASGLAAAHEAWIVHRDVKPENIMLRPDGYVKILDFGVAKLTQSLSVSRVRTEPRMLLGTLQYMAPEQLRAEGVDPRTDIWGLGSILYEMITGNAPFPSTAPGALITEILESDPPPIAREGEEIPPELKNVVAKAMKKQVSERYRNTAELLRDLREIKQELDFRARQDRPGGNGHMR